MKSVNIAVIQHRPVHMNLPGSTAKALRLIQDAADNNANVIVFGESWLSGYPAWIDHCPEIALWNSEPMKEVFAAMHTNSAGVEGEEIQAICLAAKQAGVVIALGFNERVLNGAGNGTIFNSFILINEHGRIVNHHRKLVPTFNEKLLYGMGDGAGLRVTDTGAGRIGGLICWEHWMPLSRQALHNENENIHIALWPSVHDMHQVASRHYAFEGRCYVVAAGQIMQVKDIPSTLTLPNHLKNDPEKLILNGGSCVIDPQGNYILPPQFDREEILFCSTGNLEDTIREKLTMDTSGHYNRWDIFDFEVTRKRKM